MIQFINKHSLSFLRRKLQQLLVPMLAGLMENNYDRMWSFQKFFEHSSYICDLTFISVMNLNGGDMIDLAFEKHQKYLKRF